MKKLIAVITIAAALVAPALAQQTYTKNADGSFTPVVLSTNSSGPFLSGPGMDLLSNLSSATNWGAATFGIYMPSSSGHKASMGAGAIFLYNINPYMATGLGIDWLDNQTTMPSGQFQLQLPISVGGTNGLLVTPFSFT